MTARRSAWPVILIGAAIVPALFWLYPAFVGGQAVSARDQGDFFYPIKLYTIGRIRSGEIPLWNPLSGTGEPWLGNGQSGVFYPPTLFFLLPSPAMAAALFLIFHFVVAAWGIRRLLKEYGISEAGALFGGLAYCGGGFAASLSWYWNHFGAWAYLPGLCALARSGLETRRQRLGFAALVGLSAMAGSPEMTAAAIVLSWVFLLAAETRRPEGWAPQTKRLAAARAGVGILLGLALAAWVLVPMGELALRSDRRDGLSRDQREVGTVDVLGGVASALGTTKSGTTYLSSLYVGPVVILAAIAAFGEPGRRRLHWLLVAIAFAGVIAACAGAPGSWLRAIPPLDRLRYPAKALALPQLSLSVLAGLGLDRQRFAPGSLARRWVFALLAVGAVALSLVLPRDPVVRLAGAAAGTGFFLLSCGLGRETRAGGVWAAASAISLSAALAFAGRPLFPFVPEAEIRSEPEVIAPLSHIAGRALTAPMSALARRCLTEGKFDVDTLRCQRQSLLGYTNLLFGVPTVRTAAALPTLAARRVEDSIDNSDDPIPSAGPVSARVLWTPFQPARLPSLKVGEFFRAPLAPYRPRLSFVHGFRIEPDADRAWTQVSTGRVDLVREVLLDRAPTQPLTSSTKQPLLVARLAEDRPERVVAELTSSTAGLLVLTDLWYPGWSVEADGKPAELRRADGFFRAVPLSEGTHRVVFRYRPLSVLVGAALSAAAIFLMLATVAARPARPGSVW